MKKNEFRLKINNPCTESWEEMMADGKGKHCSSCDKTVIDFSGMSESQIAEWFNTIQGRICGRFRKEQLQVVYSVPAQRPASWYNRLFVKLALTGILTLKLSEGNAQGPVNPTEQTEKDNAGRVMKSGKKSTGGEKKFISGKVIDKDTRLAIEFATVTIKGTPLSAKADKAGKFCIPLPEGYAQKNVTVTVSRHNYILIEKAFSTEQLPKKEWLVLLESQELMIMGDVGPE